jgi:hypothetical protein
MAVSRPNLEIFKAVKFKGHFIVTARRPLRQTDAERDQSSF